MNDIEFNRGSEPMPASYSVDLRKKVMEHVKQYGSITLTSKIFKISRSVIYDWKRLKKESGKLLAKTGYQNGHHHKIKDLKKFKKIVEDNSGLTLAAIVKKSGIDMSIMTCSRAMKKLNITRKKRPMDLKKEMNKKEKYS